MKEQKKRKSKILLLPGAVKRGPSVVLVPLPLDKGGPLRGVMQWNVTTMRQPNGEWEIDVRWIEPDGKTGHVVPIPNEVALLLYSQHDGCIDDCNRNRAQRAQETKKLNKQAKSGDADVG